MSEKEALSQYKGLDAHSQCIATAILQLAYALFIGIQQAQTAQEQEQEKTGGKENG